MRAFAVYFHSSGEEVRKKEKVADLPTAGGWNWMNSEVLFNPNHSVILKNEWTEAWRERGRKQSQTSQK